MHRLQAHKSAMRAWFLRFLLRMRDPGEATPVNSGVEIYQVPVYQCLMRACANVLKLPIDVVLLSEANVCSRYALNSTSKTNEAYL